MKRIVLVLAVLAVLLSFTPAKAMETTTYTGTVSSGKGMIVFVMTLRTGDVTAHATWSGKPSGHGVAYYLTVRHCINPSDSCDFTYDVITQTNSLMWPTPEMAVSILSGTPGRWRVDFSATTRASVVLNITAETNP